MAYVRSVRSTMKPQAYTNDEERTEKQASLADTVREWEKTCDNCHPLTPTTCVTDCRIWSSKNEFRKLHEKTQSPQFTTKLLNTLKNKRRLQILEVISKGQHSINRLQHELKKPGYNHSQQTITEEYVTPLLEVGLIEENQNRYHATAFGSRMLEVIKNFRDFGEVLPPHSECYEETTLRGLLAEPKTNEDLGEMMPAKSVARILSRLQTAGLIETTKEKDYVFYFKTRRDSDKAKFSPTERRIYKNIAENGASAQKLAEKTMISLRRTYKYLRKLKGKKMVFSRKKLKSYALTARGLQAALTLDKLHKTIVEFLAVATEFVGTKEANYVHAPNVSCVVQVDKQRS